MYPNRIKAKYPELAIYFDKFEKQGNKDYYKLDSFSKQTSDIIWRVAKFQDMIESGHMPNKKQLLTIFKKVTTTLNLGADCIAAKGSQSHILIDGLSTASNQ